MKKFSSDLYTQISFLLGRSNFALFRPASQSSTHGSHVAGKAVDGNEASMTHTVDVGDLSPWWKVQLAYPVWVSHVEITNRLIYGT